MTTSRVVAPLVFPVRSGQPRARAVPPGSPRRVAVPALAAIPATARPCALAVVEGRGRVTVLSVAPALGWDRETSLAVRERAGLIVLTAEDAGEARMNRQGRVQLPAGMRRWCGLRPGSRVLLVAEPDAGRLVMHPPAALDGLIDRRHAEVFGGDLP